jgi:cell wall-associated NlpC family hydrolase
LNWGVVRTASLFYLWLIMPRSSFLINDDPLDTRLFAYRPDLADQALLGRIEAARFATPTAHQCSVPWSPMFHAPGGEQCSELLFGEHFMVLDTSDGFAWGWSAHDHYVGYIAADVLVDVQSDPPAPVPMDPIEFARTYLGVPYVWGGRGGAGIDCSGLVQRCMAVRGVSAQRDSDLQASTLGRLLSEGEAHGRGDILFFPGHVGMMTDGDTMIHATRAFDKTVEEPLAIALERIAKKNDGVTITARRRVEP